MSSPRGGVGGEGGGGALSINVGRDVPTLRVTFSGYFSGTVTYFCGFLLGPVHMFARFILFFSFLFFSFLFFSLGS